VCNEQAAKANKVWPSQIVYEAGDNQNCTSARHTHGKGDISFYQTGCLYQPW
jgi:hypothetical protein